MKPTWRRPLGPEEQAHITVRHEQLAARWRQRWPDKPLPELRGDALRQIRAVQLMAHQLRRAGDTLPPGGLRRGPGMLVLDKDEREQLAELERQARVKATKPETNGGDPGQR
jgi:hypothetical protein